MTRRIETKDAPAPYSGYAQGMEVPAGARTVYVSGQVGAEPDGSVAAEPERQHELAWRNVLAIVAAAGMEKTDIVDVFAIVTDQAGVALFRNVRDRMLGGHIACSTLIVAGLASPDWKVEIAVRAAKA